MSITQTNLTEKIRETFGAARLARQNNDLPGAMKHWLDVIELTENSTDTEHRQARMASSSECALVLQELGDGRRARTLLEDAVQLAKGLVEDGASGQAGDAVAQLRALAGVQTNLAALYVGSNEAVLGEQTAIDALEAIAKTPEHSSRDLIEFAASMQLGRARLFKGDHDGGVEVLQKVAEKGVELVEKGQQHILPQAIEAAGRLFQAAKNGEQARAFLPYIEQISRIVTAAYEANGAPLFNLFVSAQMQRVNALLTLGRFADAEDQLWVMIDGSGDPQVLLAAPDFYWTLWNTDDAKLEQGGLPRAEVKDAWYDVIGDVEKGGADALAVSVMRHRFALHTEGAVDPARAFVEECKASASQTSQLAGALLQKLERELAAKGQ